MLVHLVKRSERHVSDSHLPLEIKVDSVESSEMTITISDVSETYIRDLAAASREP